MFRKLRAIGKIVLYPAGFFKSFPVGKLVHIIQLPFHIADDSVCHFGGNMAGNNCAKAVGSIVVMESQVFDLVLVISPIVLYLDPAF